MPTTATDTIRPRPAIRPSPAATALRFLLLLLLLLPAAPAAARVYLEINNPNIRKIPIAVAPIRDFADQSRPTTAAARSCREVIVDDLDFSTFFDVLADLGSYLEDPAGGGVSLGTFDFSSWSLIGAEMLIKGACRQADGHLVLELRLFDVYGQQMITGKRYRGDIGSVRLMAHRFCNEVVRAVTGMEGECTSKIAFIGRQTNAGFQEVYMMDYDGANLQQLTRNRAINMSPAWSPDVNKLCYTSFEQGNPDLYVIDFNRNSTARLAHRRGVNAAAEWSPDGNLLTLMQRFDDNSEISIISAADGRLMTRLTDNWANEASPGWSPDGSRIVFVSDRAGGPQLYIISPRGADLRRLTRVGTHNVAPHWSPRGDCIVFSALVDGNYQICTINPDGSGFRRITRMPGDCEDPQWSPNGRHIVFTSQHTGTKQLMVMDCFGREITPLTSGALEKFNPSWSANR
ncbi:MAG: Tol-Pal system beta propeller repeat protein TolB [Deltaproteobacteria bacterium]|nr:Tol-Pal system beta propeller repeat protein TolB [Candidatus Anaeroferrophillacea bacterium]